MDKAHQLTGCERQRSLVSMASGFFELPLVVVGVFVIMVHHTLGCDDETAPQIDITGFGHKGFFNTEVAGLFGPPGKTGVFC